MNEHYTEGTVPSTLSFKDRIPYQYNMVYPSFDPQDRVTFSLAGEWKKLRFRANHNWSMHARTEDWIAKTEQEGFASYSYNDEGWEAKTLPAPENHLTGKEEVHAAETYEDGVWYRKTIHWPEAYAEQVVTLKCLGVSYICDFWINESYVGYHEGGFTPFAFDVSTLLKPGENLIAVRIDNPPWTTRLDTVPAVNNDFFNYTGIIQDLYLEVVPSLYISRVDVVPLTLQGKLQMEYVLENRSSEPVTALIKPRFFTTDFQSPDWLKSPKAKSICKDEVPVPTAQATTVTLASGESKKIKETVTIEQPQIWSIREPHLYVLGLQLYNDDALIDSFYTQFGFRTLATDGPRIKLNDQSVFFAGVARHEEWPEYGRTASWERIVDDLTVLSSLHINLVRTAHYPNHIETFIALDRFGLPSMAEIPLWQFETAHYEAQERRGISYQMWREMIFSSYNRPSIAMWSTQNESKDVTLRKHYNETLVHETKTNYPDGRLLTQSSAADQPGFHDPSMEPLDVAGWTMYFGIFHGSTPYEGTKHFIEHAHNAWPDKPIMNTEYGIWSNADRSYIEKQVEIYQDVQLALLEKATVTPDGEHNPNGYVSTIDYWTAFDWYVNHNQFYQTMGIFHMDRQTKKPLYHHFVHDHQRLLQQTNGFAYKEVIPPQTLTVTIEQVNEVQQIIRLSKKEDLTSANYLIVHVSHFSQPDPVVIHLHSDEGESSFTTYNLEEYTVIPLWRFEYSVQKAVQFVSITHNKGQSLTIEGVYRSHTGTL
ncbi:glycoside hydrolase family 2 TIM barrel-domain containing protein [Shouchella miscanthi]|uniref:glycoside hydrolase family 2 TIM barrel-domain containing protein n=1 Tax=Shouchella miscanthi TaxID=2598861 RepID=UPI0011A3BF0D|nr:glycoside hydrolase family 2 TIM barrel-domain containing protein [Shouchella miscanthi]